MSGSTSTPRIRRNQVIIIATLAVVMVAGFCFGSGPARSSSKAVKLSSVDWILYQEDLSRIQRADPVITGQVLASPQVYVLQHSATVSSPAGTAPAQLFFSYSDFQNAVSAGTIPPGVSYVAYDPERWSATPLSEQQNPLHYMQLFGQLAKNNGYKPIMIPGRDLMQVPGAVCSKRQGETISQAYVRCGLPGAAAWAPIFVIQAASVELDLASLKQLVQSSAAAARAANPSATVIVTLSTTPPGGPTATASQLVTAAQTVLPYVQGFEVNTTAQTDSIMIAFLHQLAGQ